MKAPLYSSLRERGSALLLVFWALILLSAAVFAFARYIQQDLELHGVANRELEARAMAHSGMAFGLHPMVSVHTPDLAETFGPAMGYQVKIISEGGKLNVRWLLEGEDARKLMIFKQWLESRGLNFNQREHFVDCLLDWIDGDDVKRLNGVEDDGDYHPPNRMIESVEELAQVEGSQPLTETDGWQDELTIYSAGPIDLTSASPEILHLLPGLSETNIQRFVTFRAGRDGVQGTKDDPEFKSLHDVQTFLGMGDAQFKELGGLVAVRDETVRIISEGHSADVYRQVEAVVRKSGGNPQILAWKE